MGSGAGGFDHAAVSRSRSLLYGPRDEQLAEALTLNPGEITEEEEEFVDLVQEAIGNYEPRGEWGVLAPVDDGEAIGYIFGEKIEIPYYGDLTLVRQENWSSYGCGWQRKGKMNGSIPDPLTVAEAVAIVESSSGAVRRVLELSFRRVGELEQLARKAKRQGRRELAERLSEWAEQIEEEAVAIEELYEDED